MPILKNASEDEIFRLLQLFPASLLKNHWGAATKKTGANKKTAENKQTKEELCRIAAKQRDLNKIVNFISANFSRCRMHVYALTLPKTTVEPIAAVTDAEVLHSVAGGATLIMARASFVVILQDTLKKETINLLWPMRYEVVGGHPVLSMIVLERRPNAIFEENVSVISRSLDEKLIVKNLLSLSIQAADLHRGVKGQWAAGYMDAFKVKYYDPVSTIDRTMHEAKGIKATNPALYEELQKSTLFLTYFHLLKEPVKSIGDFTVDPSRGYIRFPRYTEDAADADEVVRALLTANQSEDTGSGDAEDGVGTGIPES